MAGFTILVDLLAVVFLWAVVWMAAALRYPWIDRYVRLEVAAMVAVSSALSLVLLMSMLRYLRMEG